ncbi:MAG: hypothetical protein ACRD5M_04730 [Candidatus Acidiferrales bacterium]
MKRAEQKQRRRIVHSWMDAKPLLDRWRKNLTSLRVEIKRPRLIDVVPMDFVGGEPVEREGKPRLRFRGQLIYFRKDDVTIRRPSGSILVIDTYEVVAISDGKIRFEPT